MGSIKTKILIFIVTLLPLLISARDQQQDFASRYPMEESFDADISFLIADAKFRRDPYTNKGTIKILELGPGPLSKFKGYDALYGKGKIWEKYWKLMSKFNLPIWLVSSQASAATPFVYRRSFAQQNGLDVLKKKGGIVISSLSALENNSKFKRAARFKMRSPEISKYKGIVILKRPNGNRQCRCTGRSSAGRCRLCKYASAVRKFKGKYPQFLYAGEAGFPYGSSKARLARLFNDAEIKAYKPQFKICSKKYHRRLAEDITKEVTSKFLVIKPVNAWRGCGIMIIERSQLDAVLKGILVNNNLLKAMDRSAASYWAHDRNSTFLVESFERSKEIVYAGAKYDPTLRVVFVLIKDKESIDIKFLGFYWKLPSQPINADCSFTDKHKSKINKQLGSGSARVSKSDKKEIKRLMREFMLTAYSKMLTNRAEKKLR